MRDYLYIWNNVESSAIIASGLEFRDFQGVLNSTGGILLIEHQADEHEYDVESGFAYVPGALVRRLAAENVYSWGNFAWTDYSKEHFPRIADPQISELLFFGHKGRPLHEIGIPGVGNRYLVYSHDDGWYLKLFYTHWSVVQNLLGNAIPPSVGVLDMHEFERGNFAYWMQHGETRKVEFTHDVDSVLNKYLIKKTKA